MSVRKTSVVVKSRKQKAEIRAAEQVEGEAKAKKKAHVRFVTTEEGEVVPQRFSVERSSAVPRSKANEALEWLLAGNERFRKVSSPYTLPGT